MTFEIWLCYYWKTALCIDQRPYRICVYTIHTYILNWHVHMSIRWSIYSIIIKTRNTIHLYSYIHIIIMIDTKFDYWKNSQSACDVILFFQSKTVILLGIATLHLAPPHVINVSNYRFQPSMKLIFHRINNMMYM